MCRRTIPTLFLSFALACLATVPAAAKNYPVPSEYPVAWELKFKHSAPNRIVVNVPGTEGPQAFWYVTYSVTNESDEEQTFLPRFEMVTEDGKRHRSDRNVPAVVFKRIKAKEGNKFLEPNTKVSGPLRLGA